jgi:hypothetical protein
MSENLYFCLIHKQVSNYLYRTELKEIVTYKSDLYITKLKKTQEF